MTRRRKKKYPQDAVKVEIESLSHDGRGIAHCDGKTVFIHGVLPGETITFIYTDIRKDIAEGRLDTVLQASPLRIEPKCPHSGVCGGCSLQHLDSSEQIKVKRDLLEGQLRHIGKVEPDGFFPSLTGPHWGYRHKARLGVKYVAKKGRVLVGFRERGSSFLAEIERCVVLDPKVGNQLLRLSELIGSLSIYQKMPQIEMAMGDSRCALVFRVLETPSDSDKILLRQFASQFEFDVYLQPAGPDSIVPLYPTDPPDVSYSLPQYKIDFAFKPTEFTQVNVEINRKMVDRVIEVLQLDSEDIVLDLFCGLGNFTLPIATFAGSVVGVEGSYSLVERAKENSRRNGLLNVGYYVSDLAGDLTGQPWINRNYNKVLLDPSRAGAQEILPYFRKWNTERIVYVSCNPSTLARDAGILVNDLGYRLVMAGVMDMFPQTAHVESIALFQK